ncbi:hypothetical protein ANO11243_081590 [Dothideomycetidae sp. 11243]|nr:hypothetical protein ANO11243_081590 [fungal sp. No.11243]
MVTDQIQKTLKTKSRLHRGELERLGTVAPTDSETSSNVITLSQSPQVRGINTLLLDPDTSREDFIFYFDRLVSLLVETATTCVPFRSTTVSTPTAATYAGLERSGDISAAVVLRGGSILETALRRVIPDCRTGRMLIQTSFRTGEPELHYYKLAEDIKNDDAVLLLDAQMASGGAALMAVRVLRDHGVEERRIVFVTYLAGRMGLRRLMAVYPEMKVVVGRVVDDEEKRWVEGRYLGC